MASDTVTIPKAEVHKPIDWLTFMTGYTAGKGDDALGKELLKVLQELKAIL